MKKIILAIAAVSLIVAGCAKENLGKVSSGDQTLKSFVTASVENTKATFHFDEAQCQIFWEENDAISVFRPVGGATTNVQYTLTDGAGTATATFGTTAQVEDASTYYAVYPYSSKNALADGVLTVSYPATIEGYNTEVGSVADKAGNVMVAVSAGEDFAFKNACGYLELTISDITAGGHYLSQIYIKGKDGQTINGTANITFVDGAPKVEFTSGKAETKINFAEGCDQEVIDIALPPVFDKGFEVTIVREDGCYYTATSSATLGVNDLLIMDALSFVPTKVAKIGEVEYESLPAAIDAANGMETDVTIQLIEDVRVFDTDTIWNANSYKTTIDFAGHTIYSTANVFVVETDTDFIDSVGEGGITSDVRAFTADTLVSSDIAHTVINVKGGVYRGATTYGTIRCYGTYNEFNFSGNTKIYATGDNNRAINFGLSTSAMGATGTISGDVYIESETVEGYKHMYGTMTITGGTFVGKGALLTGTNTAAKCNIQGGYFFTTELDSSVVKGVAAKVSGGFFNKAVADNFIIGGYKSKTLETPEVKDGREYGFTIEESSDPVAEVAGVQYTSLKEAVDAANATEGDVTIKILKSCSTEQVAIDNASKGVTTLDFNSFTISGSANPAVICSTSVRLVDLNNGEGGINCTSMCVSMRGYDGAPSTHIVENCVLNGKNTYGTLRTYKDQVTIIKDGAVLTAGDDARVINAGGASSAAGGGLVIEGGKFIGGNWGTLRATYADSVVIKGGEFYSAGDSVIYGGSAPTFITGGYFYAEDPSTPTHFVTGKTGIAGNVSGGWFNGEPDVAAIKAGYMADDSTPMEYNGKTYKYCIKENTVPTATVNGVNYYSFEDAFAAANAYNGGDATVTLKLCDEAAFNTESAFENVAGKPMVFDLNGYTLTTSTDSLFTVRGTVTVTDESGTGNGKISSSGKRIFTMADDATLNVKKCTLYSTGSGAYIGSTHCIVSIWGSEEKATSVVNVSDGARLINDGYMKVMYVRYGTVNTSDCEFSSLKTYSSGGYHNIYIAIGGSANIGEGTSMYVTTKNGSGGSPGGTNVYAAVKTFKGLTVAPNTWFYSIKGVNLGGTSDEYFDGRTVINGGYYANELINPIKKAGAIAEGKEFKALETPAKHTHNTTVDGEKELTYKYVVE